MIAPNKNVFTCASEAAASVSIAGGLQALGIGTSGVGGFITNALGGNAFSGATDLIQSFGSGEGGGHSVFYNMGQSVVAGPTQGFGAAFGSSIEGTAWASGPVDLATGTILGGVNSAINAGGSIVTLAGEASTAGLEAAEYASGRVAHSSFFCLSGALLRATISRALGTAALPPIRTEPFRYLLLLSPPAIAQFCPGKAGV